MARLVREEIEARLPDDCGALAEVVADARRVLRARGVSVGADGWRDAVDAELRGLVAAGSAADAHTRLLERLGG